jgi:hypothetical protein
MRAEVTTGQRAGCHRRREWRTRSEKYGVDFNRRGRALPLRDLRAVSEKALHRTHDRRKAIEIGTLVAALAAVMLAVGGLAYTLTAIDALEERILALENAARTLPQGR